MQQISLDEKDDTLSLRVDTFLLVSLLSLREIIPSTTTTKPKPSIIRAVDVEQKFLAREWLDLLQIGNDFPRIVLARGPATAPAFSTCPTRPMLFQGHAMPFPARIYILPQMGKGPERLAKRVPTTMPGSGSSPQLEEYHENSPQRVDVSDQLTATRLVLHAVEHPFGVTCSRQDA